MVESTKGFLRTALSGLALLYATIVIAWYVAYRVVGDGFWLLALASSFATYLFVPLPLMAPLAIVVRCRTVWLALSVVTLIFLVLFGGILLPPIPVARAEVEGSTLTVLTYNVLVSTFDAAPIADSIASADPDLVAFQELTPWLAIQLEKRIGNRYPYRTPVRSRCGAQAALWSAYPIQSETIDGVSACRVQMALVDVDGRPVRVANVHGWSFSSLDRASIEYAFERRMEQIESVLGFAEGKREPFILLGDLNSTPLHEVYRTLSMHLTDAFQEMGWGFGHTWPAMNGRAWGVPYPSRLVRIDHIFHSDQFRTEAAYVGEWDGTSDHRAVVARLRFAVPEAR